jgi:hypothetical protein
VELTQVLIRQKGVIAAAAIASDYASEHRFKAQLDKLLTADTQETLGQLIRDRYLIKLSIAAHRLTLGSRCSALAKQPSNYLSSSSVQLYLDSRVSPEEPSTFTLWLGGLKKPVRSERALLPKNETHLCCLTESLTCD